MWRVHGWDGYQLTSEGGGEADLLDLPFTDRMAVCCLPGTEPSLSAAGTIGRTNEDGAALAYPVLGSSSHTLLGVFDGNGADGSAVVSSVVGQPASCQKPASCHAPEASFVFVTHLSYLLSSLSSLSLFLLSSLSFPYFPRSKR